jgi:hypothetical protein
MIWKVIPFLFVSVFALADGPRFKHENKNVDQEFVNVYQDIRNAPSLGKVLQVVSTQTTTATSTTSTSFVDTGLIGTITPTSASSYIAIFVFGRLTSPSNGNNSQVTISDASGSLLGSTGQCTALENSGAVLIRESCAMHVVDSSITTDPQNYKARIQVTGGTGIFNEDLGSKIATMLMIEYDPS